jgi:hypothetical protein
MAVYRFILRTSCCGSGKDAKSMLKKKVFDHAATIAALWGRYEQLLYFE